MPLNKKEFIEIEFTGKIKDGEVFDSNIEEDIKKLHEGHDHPIEAKPFIFSLGEGMFLKAIEDFLIGKEIGTYEIELNPEKAFGKRDASLIKMVPIKVFLEQKINPVPGILLNFDGRIGKTLTVSGGRVMVDFNNPLAGKIVVYKINVKRKVTGIHEKVKAMNEFLFQKDLEFTIENKKLILKTEKNMKKFVEMFRDKFKEIFDLDLEVIEIPEIEKEAK